MNLRDEKTVVELMSTSRSELEWNSNCDSVKKHNNGYPEWWYSSIIMSGVAAKTSAKWAEK